jgi:leucyl aminopeptidase
VKVDVVRVSPETVETGLLAVPFGGSLSAAALRLDGLLGGRLQVLVDDGEAKADAGKSVVLHLSGTDVGVAARRVALVGVGADGAFDEDSVRTGAAAAARAARNVGGSFVWAFDDQLPLEPARQAAAVVEGAILGAHDPGRWKTGTPRPGLEGLTIATEGADIGDAAARAEVVARWTNHARELVDAPPNEITPAGLAAAATELLEPVGVAVEVLGPDEIHRLGLGGLAAVGRGSVNAPRLVVFRYGDAGAGAELGLVGKSVTFDSGGFFLKPQGDIVKQKADMGGGAAVVGAVGAIAELRLPISILAVLPAAENMIGGAAFRPGDVVTTASGLTVEITNPDAEGRLIMADALWYVQREGAKRLVDLATLTGAMRAALGDMYVGVFANDDDWRAELVAAGDASGDHAWPWPLPRRYRRLLDSTLADVRNTSGRSFGYAIIAASFLERFVGDVPWAHLDIHSAAFLDEERDYLGRGASGAGVRLLTELATRRAGVSP